MAQQYMANDAVESKDSYAVSSGEAGDGFLLLAISCSGGRRHRPYLNQGRDESCRMAAGKGRSCKAEGHRALAEPAKSCGVWRSASRFGVALSRALSQGQKAARSHVARGVDFCVA